MEYIQNLVCNILIISYYIILVSLFSMAMNIHGMSDHIYFVLNWIIYADIQPMFEYMANTEKVKESESLSKPCI